MHPFHPLDSLQSFLVLRPRNLLRLAVRARHDDSGMVVPAGALHNHTQQKLLAITSE